MMKPSIPVESAHIKQGPRQGARKKILGMRMVVSMRGAVQGALDPRCKVWKVADNREVVICDRRVGVFLVVIFQLNAIA
jgi:hypothetical protein